MLTHQQVHAEVEYRQGELRRAAATSRSRRRRGLKRRGDDATPVDPRHPSEQG